MFRSVSPFIGQNLSLPQNTSIHIAISTAFQWKEKCQGYNVVLVLFTGCSIFWRCNKNDILSNHSFNHSLDFYFCKNPSSHILFYTDLLCWTLGRCVMDISIGPHVAAKIIPNLLLFQAELSDGLFLELEATFGQINQINIASCNGPAYSLWMLLFLVFIILILWSWMDLRQ